MSSRLRRMTQAQGDREIVRGQEGFGSGMSIDKPRKKMGEQEVPFLLNYLPKVSYLRARPAISNTFASMDRNDGKILAYIRYGDSNSIAYTTTNGFWLGTPGLGVAPSVVGPEFGSLCYGMETYQSGFISSTNTGIYWDKFLPESINRPAPTDYFTTISKTDSATGNLDFKYRFYYTIGTYQGDLNLDDGVLVKESLPCDLSASTNNSTPYFSVAFNTALGETFGVSNTKASLTLGLPITDGQQSGFYYKIRLYRTLDIGNTDNANNPINDPTQYVFIGDYITSLGTTDYVIDESDSELADRFAGSYTYLSNIGYQPLPNGIFAITPAYLFVAEGTKVYYSALGRIDTVGFWGTGIAGPQFFDFDTNVTSLTAGSGYVIVTTASKTYRWSLEMLADGGVESSGESIPVLQDPYTASESIGIRASNFRTVVPASNGVVMALTSDGGIRGFSGFDWSENFAENKVSIETETINGAVAVFSDEDYYMLFYGDNGSLKNDKCLRLEFSPNEKRGWCFIEGDDWFDGDRDDSGLDSVPACSVSDGSSLFDINVSNAGIIMLRDNGDIYDMLYYNERENAGTYQGVCKVEFPEYTGELKHYIALHQESHLYVQSDVQNGDIPSDLSFNAEYKSQDSNKISMQSNSPIDGDVSFYDRILFVRSVGVSFTASVGGHRIIGTDTHMRVQDRPLRRFSNSQDNQNLYNELSSSILFWISRNYSLQNSAVTRSNSARYKQNAYTPSLGLDASDKIGSLELTNFITYSYDSGQTYSNATISFWIKNFSSPTALEIISTGSNTSLSLSDNEILISVDGFIDAFTLNSPLSGWDHFVFTYNGSDWVAYQNKEELVVSFTSNAGNMFFQDVVLNPDISSFSLSDVRIYSSILSEEAIGLLNSDMLQNGGVSTIG